MRKTVLFILALTPFCFAFSPPQNEYPFKCGEALPYEVIRTFKMSSFSDYSDKDIKMLDAINSYIIGHYDKSVQYEIFINQKTDTTLVMDIFGLEKEEEVDETSCWIFNSKDLDLPARTTLLFHRYINDSEDGGVVVGLTWKK